MSTTVDQRVVEMRFDNRHFETNVETTMSSLDRLRQSLNLKGATKGLENVDAASKKVDMSLLGSAVDTIGLKFNAMYSIADQALRNITNSAINAGKRIASALTIDPIKAGFSEYETQINAIQTILANTQSKGTTLTDVNSALDELNTYADKTIYNFTEMTRNIGTFTAAGVDLDTSVSAIKGIANLAAVSGSTSQQASTAMYQLSQAMASGTVKLMDWNSVVNAGMGGQVFQDALKETARVHGIEIDKMIEKDGSFRETLKNGWLTTEVLTETLAKFTGDLSKEQLLSMGYTETQAEEIMKLGQTANDAATKVKTFTQLFDTLKEAAQSGWTQTWEILIGDFEEAKKLLTEISDVMSEAIGNSAKARNEVLQGWKDMGGRNLLIGALRLAFEGLVEIIKPIKEAFAEIFPPITAKRLYDLTVGLKDLARKFKISEETAAKLKSIFKGVFALVDIGVTIIKALASGFAKLLGFVAPAGDGLLGFLAGIGEFIVSVRDAIKSSDFFGKTIGKIVEIIGKALQGIRDFAGSIKDAFLSFVNVDTSGVEQFSEKMESRFAPLGELVSNVFGAIGKAIDKVMPLFMAIGNLIGRVFGGLISKIGTAFSTGDFSGLFDILNGALVSGGLLGLKKFIDALSNIAQDTSGFVAGIAEIKDAVVDTFGAMQTQLKAGALLKIAGAIAILAASLVVLSMLDSAKLGVSLAAITTLFVDLLGTMLLFDKMSGSLTGMSKVSGVMIALSVSVLILSFALAKIASIPVGDLVAGVIAIAALSGIMVASATALSKSSGKLIKGASGLIFFAAAILILTSAVEKLSTLDPTSLTKGLIGVGVLCAELALFLKMANFDGMGVSTGLGLIALAAAINILANAVGKFGAMNPNALIKGLAGVGAVMLEIVAFTKLMGNTGGMISTGIGLTIIAASMLIFAQAIGTMGNLSMEQIGKGLLTMAGALAAVTLALNFMPKNMLTVGVGLIGVAAALLILSNALTNMGSMSWGQLAVGLVALAGSLTIIAVAMHFMAGALPGAAALLVISAALAMFAPVLILLGSVSLATIGKGLLALAGVFVVLGVAAAVLTPLVPTLLALGAAVTLFGVGCLAVGAGIMAFSMGLSALAVSGAAGAAALVSIISSLLSLIPLFFQQIGLGILELCNVITQGAPAICQAITAIVLAVIEALTTCMPPLIEALGVLLDSLLQFLVTYIPKLTEAGMKMILGFLQGIANNIGQITYTAIQIITEFVNGISAGLPLIIQSAIDLMINFINGLADGIRNNTNRMIDAVYNLMDAVIGAIAEWAGSFFSKGSELLGSLVSGISSVVGDAVSAAGDLIGDVKDAIVDFVSDFVSAGVDLVNGFIEGIGSMIDAAVKKAVELAGEVWSAVCEFLGIESPSKKFIEIGRYTDEGLAIGLKKYSGMVVKSAVKVGETAVDSMSKTLGNISSIISGDIDTQPTIRPVLDLSDVKSGANAIGGMLSGGALIVNTRAAGTISASMSKIQNGSENNELASAITALRKDLATMPRNNYTINGVTYDDGSNLSNAMETIVRYARIERRV